MFNTTVAWNKKAKVLLGPYANLRVNKKAKEPEKEEVKRTSSMIINLATLVLVIVFVAMSVISIPEPEQIQLPARVEVPVTVKGVVNKPDVGLMIGFKTDSIADLVEHLYNDHGVVVSSVTESWELMIGPFVNVDQLMDYLLTHNLADHLNYVVMRDGKKVYYKEVQNS